MSTELELSTKEEKRQLRVLTELRTRHHNRLVDSGIARRILDAEAPVNYLQNGDDFTEGTLFYPTRKKVAELAIGSLWGIEETVSGSCVNAPQDLAQWGAYLHLFPNADIVMLGRIEAHNNGWGVNTIYVGMQHERDSLSDSFMPLNGVEQADILVLGELLDEVKTVRESQDLTCLDPDSLVNTTIGRYAPTPMP